MAQQQAAVCTQVHPPTAVTHCNAAWLTRGPLRQGGAADFLPDVVVVRSTQLELYCICGTSSDTADGTADGQGSAAAAAGPLSLELLASSQLWGVVESAAVLRGRAPGQRDALLLTFRDAKLSVLHWDAARHELAHSSLHYFEGDASLRQGRTLFAQPPLALADPLGRCAAVLMYRHQLAVLPAVDSELLSLGLAATAEEDEEAAAAAALGLACPAPVGAGSAAGVGTAGGATAAGASGLPSAAAAVGNSYVDNLGKAGIKKVRDAVFLHGYNEPVLALLHEAEPTWAGNLRQKKDTCVLTCLSLNLTRKHHPKIWGAQGLPSDAYRLSAVPCGGLLVLCQHLVLHYRQGCHTGVVLHPSALPPAAPPPPLAFDPRAMVEAGGPGPAAAAYAKRHAMDVHPDTVPAAVQFCDTSHAAELRVTADGASVCWLSADSALLCLHSGQLLQLALLPAPGGGVAVRLEIARAGAAPPPACCCSLPGPGLAPSRPGDAEAQPALLFLGSAAGDSLLVRASPVKESNQAGAKRAADGGVEPATKRFRLESTEVGGGGATPAPPDAQNGTHAGAAAAAGGPGSEQAGAAASDSEDEEAMIYGAALGGGGGGGGGPAGPLAAVQQLQRYQLKVLDSLANIGPVRDFVVAGAAIGGGRTAAVPPMLVACSGEGKGGTLSVLRRSVVPDIITEVPLPGLLGAWAVRHVPDGGDGSTGVDGSAENGTADQGRYHSYLLLSFVGATKVLATGEELREVTESVEFAVDTPTLAAACLLRGRRLAQAFPQGLRLLDGEESLQDVWASQLSSSGASIAAADFCDPFALLLLSDGCGALLAADSANGRLSVDDSPAAAAALTPSSPKDRIVAASLFADACGWLAVRLQPQGDGCCADSSAAASGTAYALLCRAGGTCQLYALPEWRLVWASAGSLADAPTLLTAAGDAYPGAAEAATSLDGAEAEVPGSGSSSEVVELRLVSFGPPAGGRRDVAAARGGAAPAAAAPLLLALTADHQLLAYRAFVAPGSSRDGSRVRLRFRRLPLDVPPLLPPAGSPADGSTPRLPRLHPFEGLGEEAPHSGVFVAGLHPHWLVAARGTLLAHPHHLQQTPGGPAAAAVGFTPFHNVNCPHGFILATGGVRSAIQISQLPPRTRLDAPWPRQRVSVKGTPLKVAHYAEADLFAVLCSRQVPFKPFLPEEDEPGEPAASYSYALAEAAAAARGTMQGHELRLVWPGGGWQGVWRHQLLPGERALSVAAVRLKDQTSGATVPLLAVGAALPAGEDYPCGGRLLLFEVARDAAGQWAGRQVYSREFRGPVTGLAGLEGYLLLASGNRIETCVLSSSTLTTTADDGTVTADTSWKLTRSAFYDGPVLLTSLNVVKNFVLLGDCQHSVQFVRYRDEGRQLSLLSKDFNRADTAATQFLINGSSLHLAAADCAGTLRLLSYAPAHPGSWKGQRLLAWGCFHLGDPATAMQRLRLHPPSSRDATARQAVLLAAAPGSLALVAPLALAAEAGVDAAAALPALRALLRELALLAPQAAGLNPAAFRRRYAAIPPGMQGGRCFAKPLPLEEQGVLDGDLLRQYTLLPRAVQEGAAEAAGLQRPQLMQLLQGLWRASGTLL